ncbi:MAG: lamin tail domain-containing protein [Bacteroidetes bacterium]|nr:lamin tail domain-containing protein [Bacteroidota bacterium]
MQNLLILIFSLLVTMSNAQLADNFTDGDFTSNPQWQGDSADFIVNSSGMLQLNSAIVGNSTLAVPINMNYNDTLEWRIKTKLDFAPSSGNYCRIYLAADTNNSQSSVSGYFLQLGESLSNDAIELFRQSGTVITSVCRGTDGQIAAAFEIQIRVLRFPSGLWQVFADENLTGNYSQIASGSDPGNPAPDYFFLDCNYTSGNLQRFYFDDVYAGKFIPDDEKPSCTSIEIPTDTTIKLQFSEQIDFASANTFANYNIISIGNPSQLTIDSLNDYSIMLFFPQHFTVGDELNLHLQNLRDAAGNRMNDTSIAFSYHPIGSGMLNDIIISEIYFEMSSLSPLPNAEFIELFNRSDSAINLAGWTISDGSSDAMFPDYLLKPNHYVVVYDLQNDQLFSAIQNRIGVVGFPGLNNDSGDTLTLMNSLQLEIETVPFNDDSYHNNDKNDGGWTTERIDANFTCQDQANWKASENTAHGTPGLANSVAGIHTDYTTPWIDNLYIVDSLSLQIEFSESIFSTIIPSGFIAIDKYNVANDCISVNQITENSFLLEFANQFADGIYHLKINDTLRDCTGNAVDLNIQYRFGKTQPAAIGDVVINEILFDPRDGGEDFVELFNCSSKIIDLNKWIIQEAEADDENSVKDESQLSSDHRILFPGEYLAFTKSVAGVTGFYNCPDLKSIVQLEDIPDFNSDEGRVVLRDGDGNRLDAFRYSDDMHFYLLNSPNGVSLERLNGYFGDPENAQWHSAASTVGFATPGFTNSHWVGENPGSGKIDIVNEVFSPDNNGYEDLLTINFQFEDPGTILSLSIFSKDGSPIRELLVNQTVSGTGQIFWDGFSDAGKLVYPGRYLIWAKAFSLEKGTEVFRSSCVVAVKE